MAPSQYVTAAYWPVILITVDDSMDLTGYQQLFDAYEKLLNRESPCVTLTDLTRVRSRPDARCRKLAADKALSWRPLVERYSLGDARVVTSAVVRGALTAVGWLYQHPMPIVYCATLSAGVGWCVGRLELARVPLGTGIEDLRRTASRSA